GKPQTVLAAPREEEGKAQGLRVVGTRLGAKGALAAVPFHVDAAFGDLDGAVGVGGEGDGGAAQRLEVRVAADVITPAHVRPVVIADVPTLHQRHGTHLDAVLGRLGVTPGDLVPQAV